MTTKTSGAEFKQFYRDEKYWPNGSYHDDSVITLNGVEVDGDTDLSTADDDSLIVIESGFVYLSDRDVDLENHFLDWRSKQRVRTILVHAEAEKFDAIVAAVEAAGGKVC